MNIIKPEGERTILIGGLDNTAELKDYFQKHFNVKEEIDCSDKNVYTYALGTEDLEQQTALVLRFFTELHSIFKDSPVKVRAYPEVSLVSYEEDDKLRCHIRARLGKC